MLILFASDIHIGEQRRLADTEVALDFLAQTVIQKQPHYTVLLGDIFDKRKPTPLEIQVFNKFLRKIKDVGKVLILEGNHDIDRDISTLSYLKDLDVWNVAVVRPPFVHGSFYLGHEHINGAQVGDGYTLSGGKSLSDIIKKHLQCSMFAFGDFHKPQILKETPFCFYAGSLIKTTFAEKHDTKFLWLFENEILLEKIEVPGRAMIQFDISIEEDVDREAPWEKYDSNQLKGALVKIVYSGTKSALNQIHEDWVKRRLLEGLHVKELRIEYNVINKSKPRNENINESATTKDVLKEYFNDKEVEHKEDIIKSGEKLLNE